MNIHEFQAKELFRRYGVPVPQGSTARTAADACHVAEELGQFPVVVKAQIHAGGRGKGGGVQLAKSLSEVSTAAQQILDMTLVTPQTGPQGKRVHTILIEEGVLIERELYLSILINRRMATIDIIASQEGGMDIEEVAARSPEKIIKVSINPLTGVEPSLGRKIASDLAIPQAAQEEFASMLPTLYKLFVEYDCSLLEINPLVITGEDEVIALDAKIEIDDNSLFRHADIVAMRDKSEEDPLEVEAKDIGLSYINLSGNVGNMVNGAGLAMATMDLIKQAGAEPANFLDVGGGANALMVENGFRIIMGDPNVQAVLVNIFGGILRCDVLAQGVVQAARKTGIKVPLVVRMEGTNVEEGRRILTDAQLNVITAKDLQDATEKIAEVVAR